MSGTCLRRDTHCSYLYGSGSKVDDTCMAKYNEVSRGWASWEGNCGEQWFPSSERAFYFSCKAEQDSLCGKLQCTGGSDEIQQTEFK